jgi:hypothetical protein
MSLLNKFDINFKIFQKIIKHFKKYLEDLTIFEPQISNSLI